MLYLFDQRELLIRPSCVCLCVQFISNMIGLEVSMYNKASSIWKNYSQGGGGGGCPRGKEPGTGDSTLSKRS